MSRCSVKITSLRRWPVLVDHQLVVLDDGRQLLPLAVGAAAAAPGRPSAPGRCRVSISACSSAMVSAAVALSMTSSSMASTSSAGASSRSSRSSSIAGSRHRCPRAALRWRWPAFTSRPAVSPAARAGASATGRSPPATRPAAAGGWSGQSRPCPRRLSSSSWSARLNSSRTYSVTAS